MFGSFFHRLPLRKGLTSPSEGGIIVLTEPIGAAEGGPMTKKSDDKTESLRRRGCLNPDPSRVTDELFDSGEFFDAEDLVQVKYEMLRRVRAEQPRHSAFV